MLQVVEDVGWTLISCKSLCDPRLTNSDLCFPGRHEQPQCRYQAPEEGSSSCCWDGRLAARKSRLQEAIPLQKLPAPEISRRSYLVRRPWPPREGNPFFLCISFTRNGFCISFIWFENGSLNYVSPCLWFQVLFAIRSLLELDSREILVVLDGFCGLDKALERMREQLEGSAVPGEEGDFARDVKSLGGEIQTIFRRKLEAIEQPLAPQSCWIRKWAPHAITQPVLGLAGKQQWISPPPQSRKVSPAWPQGAVVD